MKLTSDTEQTLEDFDRVDISPEGTIVATDGKSRGLYQKFRVRREDGRDEVGEKHFGCEYFVLDLTHNPFAMAALFAYAKECESEFPQLAADIRMKLVSIGEDEEE